MKKYRCVRGWVRNSTGEIIEEWQYNKLPDEIKNRNFEEYVEPVVEQPIKPISKPLENIKPKTHRLEVQKPEWFNVEEESKED